MSSSGAILLPEDVVIQILSRLPVKSLLRFKCVCKYWYSLIKSPCFIGQHYHHHNNRTQLLVHHCTPDTRKGAFALFPDERLAICQNLDYLHMPTFLVDVVGPVNGVFLLHMEWCTHGSHLALWNPATREFRTLPGLDSNLPRHFMANENYFGFGIDSLTNDYKVIWIRYLFDEDERYVLYDSPVIGVYTLGTDSWRLLDPDSASMPPNLYTYSSIYMNGAHYWYDDENHNPTIVAFDMRNEVFRVIQAPPECTLGCLSLYNDSIALISWKALESEVSVDVWVMEQEGYWTKHFSIGSIPDVRWLQGLWKNDELLFETKSLELVLYNLNSHEVRNIGIKTSEYGYKVFKYKESLVSVNVGNKNSERYSLSDLLQDFFTYKGPKCKPRSGSICVFCSKFKDKLSLYNPKGLPQR